MACIAGTMPHPGPTRKQRLQVGSNTAIASGPHYPGRVTERRDLGHTLANCITQQGVIRGHLSAIRENSLHVSRRDVGIVVAGLGVGRGSEVRGEVEGERASAVPLQPEWCKENSVCDSRGISSLGSVPQGATHGSDASVTASRAACRVPPTLP